MKLQLIPCWRDAWRLWSVRLHVAATAVAGALVLVPTMPAELQALVPLRFRVIALGAWAIAGLAARLVKQRG